LKKKKIIEGLNVYETFVKIIFSAHIPRRMEKKNNPQQQKNNIPKLKETERVRIDMMKLELSY